MLFCAIGTPPRKQGKSEMAQAKQGIQAILRQIVIARDGGCILRHYPEAGVGPPARLRIRVKFGGTDAGDAGRRSAVNQTNMPLRRV